MCKQFTLLFYFYYYLLRRLALTSFSEVCEIRDLLSVGGGRAANRRVGDESILVYATLPRCVFLWLCSTLSCCVFKLSAAYAKSQQGEENGTPLEKNKKQQSLKYLRGLYQTCLGSLTLSTQ